LNAPSRDDEIKAENNFSHRICNALRWAIGLSGNSVAKSKSLKLVGSAANAMYHLLFSISWSHRKNLTGQRGCEIFGL
jgi:hypothetical protein